MIQVEGLVKKLGGKVILKEVSFSVKKGEIAAFLGPNGAGKTTTMRVLTGYYKPDGGKVQVGGYTHERAEEIKKIVGYLPERPPLYGDLTVVEYLRFVGSLKGLSKRVLKERIDYVVDTCGISEFAQRPIKNLSKGQQQRVGIAQAIIHDPEILIFDEPTIGLDPNQGREVRELIKELGREKTVILSTHILPEAESVCEKAIIIHKGEIVADGTLEEIYKRFGKGKKSLVRVMDPSKKEKAAQVIRSLDGVLEVTMAGRGIVVVGESGDELRSQIAKALVENGLEPVEIRPYGFLLEEVFATLTTEEKGA